jgi:hypothetical protein
VIAGLDTSVLVRVLTGEPGDLALVAVRYLEERRRAGDPVRVSDWVLAETYHALQYLSIPSVEFGMAGPRSSIVVPR